MTGPRELLRTSGANDSRDRAIQCWVRWDKKGEREGGAELPHAGSQSTSNWENLG